MRSFCKVRLGGFCIIVRVVFRGEGRGGEVGMEGVGF